MDTLIQNSALYGQGFHPVLKVLLRIDDFVGAFSTDILDSVTVERLSTTTKAINCGGTECIIEELQFSNIASTGIGCWLSSYVMIPWLIQNKEILKGKKILELGAGVGICGIVAASFSPLDVTISDHDTEIIDLISRNIERNTTQMPIRPKAKMMEWCDDEKKETYDVIIASDCIYKSTADSFLSAVFRHLEINGQLFLINPPETSRPGVDQVIYALQERGVVEIKEVHITMAALYHKELCMIHLTDFDRPDDAEICWE
jgi:2-polyprenyl-3-methyl-5-hydroxy-6-metoxy-1,4-benzoquinol methylase